MFLDTVHSKPQPGADPSPTPSPSAASTGSPRRGYFAIPQWLRLREAVKSASETSRIISPKRPLTSAPHASPPDRQDLASANEVSVPAGRGLRRGTRALRLRALLPALVLLSGILAAPLAWAQAPPKPTSVTGIWANNQATITFTVTGTVTGANWATSTANSGQNTSVTSLGSNQYRFTAGHPANLGARTYYVRARNGQTNGQWSDGVTVSPPTPAPSKPTSFTATADDGNLPEWDRGVKGPDGTIRLRATVTGTVTKWQYRRAATSSGLTGASWTDIASSASTTLSHALAAPSWSRTWYFQVRAVNGTHNGAASDTASATLGGDLRINSLVSGLQAGGELHIDEGSSGTFTVRLDARPGGSVTVTVRTVDQNVVPGRTEAAPPDSSVTVDTDPGRTGNQSTLTFTASNWNVPQPVTVGVTSDTDQESEQAWIEVKPSGAQVWLDPVHTQGRENIPRLSYQPAYVHVQVRDTTGAAATGNDDGAGGNAVTALARAAPDIDWSVDSLALAEGPFGDITVSLAEAPTDDVTLTFTSADAGAVTVDTDAAAGVQGTLTIARDTWRTARTVRVSAPTDDDSENESVTLTVRGSGGGYEKSAAELAVTVTDNATRQSDDAAGATGASALSSPAPPTGQVMLSHVSGGTAACLDVSWAQASDGQNVHMWDCNGTLAQSWRLEKRASGDQAGRYRLVSRLGGSSYCLDNAADFSDGGPITIWSCHGDDNPHAAFQSFDVEASGSGWTLSFAKDGTTTYLAAQRSGVRGNAVQHSTSSSATTWHISSDLLSLSVADATAQEAAGAQMAFTVSTSRAVRSDDGTVTVAYATSDGTATAGTDYTAASGTLTFAAGETSKTVNVAVLDDAHDDDGETFALTLSNAAGAAISDASATGTITNADLMPKAWLGRFGRAVAEQALGGISERIAGPRTPGLAGMLAGQALATGTLPADAYGPTVGGHASSGPHRFGLDRFGGGRRPQGAAQTMTMRQALAGTAFTLTGEPDAAGGSPAFWGRGAHTAFDGREDTLSLDGEVTTGMLGMDYAKGEWLVGLALTQSAGEGSYRDGTSGKVESTLTAALPYAALDASERLKLWAAAGYGTGGLTLTPEGQDAIEADLDWTMAAAGARGEVLSPSAGPALAVTSDALWTRTASDRTAGLDAATAEVTRLRLGLEGSWAIELGGGTLAPKLATGIRHDGGDAEAGFGVELGGGIAWTFPRLGLSLDLEVRTLLAHEVDGRKDRGYAASLTFDPAPQSARGASLSLRHDLGGAASGGLEALFAPDPLDRRTGADAAGRWTMEAAYGLPVFGGRFTGSPHAGVGVTEVARDYTLGWRMTPEGQAASGLSFGLRATRLEGGGAPAEHVVGVEAVAGW